MTAEYEAKFYKSKPPRPTLNNVASVDFAPYDDEPIPTRRWTVENRYSRGVVSLLSGEGGMGKSVLFLQLAAAHVLGRDWLRAVPVQGPVILINCEDDENELVIRMKPIADFYGARFAALMAGLHAFPLVGTDTYLALPDRDLGMKPTPLFGELLNLATLIRPICIIIDNVADTFGGDEINRAQVRAFVALMRRLAIIADAHVAMSSHPSLTGITSKTGLSGSTHWHNACRQRAYLHAPTKENGETPEAGLRELEFLKNNYGPLAETVPLQWKNGLYVPVARKTFMENLETARQMTETFLALLDRFIHAGRKVSPNASANNYAPTVFANEKEAKSKSVTKHGLEEVMRHLFASELIAVEEYGPPSRRSQMIIRRPST